MTATAPDPLIGQVLGGRYRIDARIGRGAHGVIYKANHLTLNRPLAVKLLSASLAEKPLAVKRLEREGQVIAKIGHENIVGIVDFSSEPGLGYYFVMEFLEGETLQERLNRESPLPVDVLLPIAREVCEGLIAAHEAGVMHRDIKPENVFLARSKKSTAQVKILDFGLAGMMEADEDEDRLTRTGVLLGTPAYMSPEQAMGEHVDHLSDLYSLGVLLYEMTTGRVPFKGENWIVTLKKQREEAPVPPRTARPDLSIPATLEHVILKLLRKDKRERHQSAREVLAELSTVGSVADKPPSKAPSATQARPVATKPVAARPAPISPPAEAVVVAREERSTMGDMPSESPARRWAFVIVAGAFAVAMLVWALLSRH